MEMETANKPPEAINYQPEQSAALAVGIGCGGGAASIQMVHSANDVKYIMDGLTSYHNGVLPKENTAVYTAQDDYDQCTSKGIKEAFKQQLSKVSKDGLFVVVLSGPAVQAAPSESAPLSCYFQTVDYNPSEVATHLTAATFIEWLASAPTKPKHVLFILDMPFAGKFSKEMVDVDKKRQFGDYSLCILSAQDGPDKPFIIDTLGHSIFTYFLMWAFRTTPFTPGLVPLRQIHEITKECCDAFSSLIVTYNPKEKELKQNTVRPRATYSIPLKVLRELTSSSEEDTDATNDSNESVGRFEFVTKYFDRRSPSKMKPLHDKVLAHLEIVGDINETSALSKLNRHGLLQDNEVLLSVVSSLMFSIASIQVAEDEKSVSNPNLFIYSFLVSTATISAVKPDVKFDPVELFRRSKEYYMQVVRENPRVDVKKLEGLFHKIESETKVVS